jgi:hypothetical protein
MSLSTITSPNPALDEVGDQCSAMPNYLGLKLYLVCAGDGMPVMWCLANPKIGESEVVTALLKRDHHLIRSGQVLLADKGFSGKTFAAATAGMGLRLLRPNRRDERYKNGNLGGVRVVDRIGQPELERAAWPGETRWPHPPVVCLPASLNVFWRCRQGSGTTGTSATPPNDP